MLRAFGHHVAMWCDMLGVVGSSLKMVGLEPIAPNMFTCCDRLAGLNERILYGVVKKQRILLCLHIFIIHNYMAVSHNN